MLDYFCHYSTNAQSYKSKRARIGRPFDTKHYSDMIKMYLLLPNRKSDDKYSSLLMTANLEINQVHLLVIFIIQWMYYMYVSGISRALRLCIEDCLKNKIKPSFDLMLIGQYLKRTKRETFEQVMSFHIGHQLCHGQSILCSLHVQLEPCQQYDVTASEYL